MRTPSAARVCLLLAVSILMAGGCAREEPRAGDSSGAAPGLAVDGSEGCANPQRSMDSTMAPPVPGWHPARWNEWGDDGPRDRGQGVLFRNPDPGARAGQPCEEVTRLHAAPDSSSEVVGAFGTTFIVPGWSLRPEVWARQPLAVNLVEFAYEQAGLAYDSVDATGRWRRAIVGFDEDGEPHMGWAFVDGTSLRAVDWRELLLDAPLYFIDVARATLHASPGGPVVSTPHAIEDARFDMTAVEARWPWLRVKVEHPGETCAGNVPATRRTDYYWIRAIDVRGRPAVFYYTRGC